MSLKDVIFKMSRHLIETCENSEDLRLKQTAFPRKRRLDARNLLRILLRIGWLTHCSLELMLTMIFSRKIR